MASLGVEAAAAMLSVRIDKARGVTPLFGGHEKGLSLAVLVRHGSQEMATARHPYDGKVVDMRSTIEIWDGEVREATPRPALAKPVRRPRTPQRV